ncbi:MAG: DNA-3-methyladenine glycosylase 2 family protein [Lentisphaerae bacterium]|nr:DNA-3-methyladenine glycosylase 2 family protein [Lentisphaerota bacterium]MCP4103260.1 DNA-3-methyladenine glycosylase 2 family protein [Lentisphaerota bacterium]
MEKTKNIYSQARIMKDKNFDGKFLFGVKTTNIFCRPSCPSPTAKEENVVYFESIFEALKQGFRPCHRCRPDIETDCYNGNIDGSLLINRTIHMIYDGFLNHHSVTSLARKLLVSERHLRKLFVDNLGMPPIKVAKYHRALFAKKLLMYSNSPVTEIAYASGFNSLRQFNDVIRETFEQSPTQLRKEFKNKNIAIDTPVMMLSYKKPFDFKNILSFMRPRALLGIEVVTEVSYSRTFRTAEAHGYFSVTDNAQQSALELRIHCDDVRSYMDIHNRVRKVFDLDTDFTRINELFSKDKILSRGMINGCAPRLPRAFNPFEFVIRAVLGQQISVKTASTLAARIVSKAAVKTDKSYPEGLDFFFPTPEELLKTDITELGITSVRQKTIKTVSQAIYKSDLLMTDNQTFEKFNKDFSKLKGIGDWTVNYVAMRGLGMFDSFPAGDLGIIKALIKGDKKPSHKEVLEIAEKWRPYRSYAALCLWNNNN